MDVAGAKRRACQGLENTTGRCEIPCQERIQIRSKPLTIYPSERIKKTVVSCRDDMEAYQEECEDQ